MRRQLLSTLPWLAGFVMDAQWLKRSLRLTPRLYCDGTHQWGPFMSQARPLKAPLRSQFDTLLCSQLDTPLPTQPRVQLPAPLLTVSGYFP